MGSKRYFATSFILSWPNLTHTKEVCVCVCVRDKVALEEIINKGKFAYIIMRQRQRVCGSGSG